MTFTNKEKPDNITLLLQVNAVLKTRRLSVKRGQHSTVKFKIELLYYKTVYINVLLLARSIDTDFATILISYTS